jgi:hypothetical protein
MLACARDGSSIENSVEALTSRSAFLREVYLERIHREYSTEVGFRYVGRVEVGCAMHGVRDDDVAMPKTGQRTGAVDAQFDATIAVAKR